jgi:hypothetical protein
LRGRPGGLAHDFGSFRAGSGSEIGPDVPMEPARDPQEEPPVKCWGTVRPGSKPCDRRATMWCTMGNIRYAVCERHAAANGDKDLQRMKARARMRRSQ